MSGSASNAFAPAVAASDEAAPGSQTSRREAIFTLILLTLATLAVGLWLALDPRWGYDEAWHLYLSTVSPWTKALEENLVDAHPPLHHLLLMQMARLGSDPFWFRLPSVLAAALMVPLWYLLLRRMKVRTETALLGVVLLITSFAFLDLGVVVRSYSLGLLFLLVGLLGATSLVPQGSSTRVGPDTQSRQMTLTAALGLTVAFAFIYSALFVTFALFVALSLIWAQKILTRKRGLREWVRGWHLKDWAAFILMSIGHLFILVWFVAGYGRGRGVSVPAHMETLVLGAGESLLDFGWRGLAGNAAWLTPQFPETQLGQTIAVAVFWLAATVVLLLAMRQHQPARILVVLSAFFATGFLFVAGVLGVYPFGGLMRHQSVLLPLYLLLIILAIDVVWSWLSAQRWQRVLGVAVVAFALVGLYRAQTLDPVGEGETGYSWSNTLGGSELECDPKRPIYLEGVAFYPVYAGLFSSGIHFRGTLGKQGDALTEIPYGTGWLKGLTSKRDWDLYETSGLCPATRQLIRDRRHWTLPAVPDTGFLANLKTLMAALGVDSLQMVQVRLDGEDGADPETLTAVYREAGLSIREYERLEQLDAWVVGVESSQQSTLTAD
jgi:hypothetical protein